MNPLRPPTAQKKVVKGLAPQVGLEPTTLRLTAECSTIELLRSNAGGQPHYIKIAREKSTQVRAARRRPRYLVKSTHAMDEQEFRTRADESLGDLYRRLAHAADRHDFEADFNSGGLPIGVETPPPR